MNEKETNEYYKELLKVNSQSDRDFQTYTYLSYGLLVLTIIITFFTGDSNFNKLLLLAISISFYGMVIVINQISFLVSIENNNNTIYDLSKELSFDDLFKFVNKRNKKINMLNYTIIVCNALGILSFVISILL
jgi:hypothetical protein